MSIYTFSIQGNGSVAPDDGPDDSDGIGTSEEQGPSGNDASYDGNGDGRPDWEQSNVCSLYTYADTTYVTLATPAGTTFTRVRAKDLPSLMPKALGNGSPTPPQTPTSAANFPFGLFSFTVECDPGQTLEVTLYLPSGSHAATYYKYGPTPDDPTDHWYEFLYDGTTGAEIDGNVITLHFVDGQRGDDDLTANGEIVDDGGPVVYPTTLQLSHLANDAFWQTGIELINMETFGQSVTCSCYGENAEPLAPLTYTLESHACQTLELPPLAVSAMIEADGRVAAWVRYSSADGSCDTLVATSTERTTLAIPHLDNSGSWWNGVALANMNSATANVVIHFDNGKNYTFSLDAQSRKAFTIKSLGDEYTTAQSATVTSDQPISGLLIYGQSAITGAGDHSAATLGGFDQMLTVPVGSETSDWIGLGLHTSSITESDLHCEQFVSGNTQTQELGLLQGQGHKAFILKDVVGTSSDGVKLTASSYHTFFGESIANISGIMVVGKDGKVGAYNINSDGFTKGIAKVTSLEDKLRLFNSGIQPANITCTAYEANGTATITQTQSIAAGTVGEFSVSELAPSATQTPCYLLLQSDKKLYGRVESEDDTSLKVYQVVGY